MTAPLIEVTPALCMHCGACCSVEIDGEFIACRHLQTADGRVRSAIYSTRPQVCRSYSCVRGGQLSSNPMIADRVLAAVAASHANG